MHHYSATLGPLPAGKQVVLQTNIKLIEYPIDGLVDDIVQALWPVVKSRYRRHYHRPQLCSLNQQTQMAQMERRFPNVYGIDMPTANELIAHGREVDEIRQIIGADGLIFQDLNDLIDAVRAENPDIQQFECSVFNGVYVTRDVDQQYLDYLDSLRNDDAKAVQLQNEVENLEMHNEG